MLFTLSFDEEKETAPAIFVAANSLKEAYDKFYASELKDKFKNLTQICEYCSDTKVIDIHKKLNPYLFGFAYKNPNNGEETYGMCIADSFEQVMEKFHELDLTRIYNIEDKKEIIIT